MKTFNLEEAKAGKPVITRDGRPVRIICFDKISPEGYPLIALTYDKDGIERIKSYDQEGRFVKGDKNSSDLFMVSELTQEISSTYNTTTTLNSFQHCNFIFKK